MSNIELAKQLLAWNTENLNSSANWSNEELAQFFADEFIVFANGRRYEANYQNYADFLNNMRRNLESIKYQCHDIISNDNYIVIPLVATLTYLNHIKEQYEAILILHFNSLGKIVLWHEVYSKTESNST